MKIWGYGGLYRWVYDVIVGYVGESVKLKWIIYMTEWNEGGLLRWQDDIKQGYVVDSMILKCVM